MIRIFLEKREGVRDALKKAAAARDADIVLVVPKDSALAEENGAFARIAKEVKTAKKRVRVESVDEHVLELAAKGGMESVHPFFGESRGKPISDIVVADKKKKGGAKGVKKGRGKAASKEAVPPEPEPVQIPVPIIHEAPDEVEEDAPSPVVAEPANPIFEFPPEAKEKRRVGRTIGRIFIWAAVLIVAGYGATAIFWSKVDVVIALQKKEWSNTSEMRATKTVGSVAVGSLTIPAEVFTLEKNTTELYPATGRSTMSERATGKLVVYNEYGVQSQTLVVRTRFLTPDGKIYRLTKTITVPGAKLQNGKLVPSSIEATVVADGAGPSYNTGPIARLSIPGFKGTPRENGFYGVMPEGASGGVTGEHAVSTSQDIAAARTKVQETLRSVLIGTVRGGMPDDFTLLDDAIRVTVTKITVNSSTDAQGNFSVYGAAQMKAIGFREQDVQKALQYVAQKEDPQKVFLDAQFTYSAVKARFDEGDVSFAVATKGTLWTSFDVWEFEKKILGKKIDEVRGMIGRTAGVTGGSVQVWPQFAVTKVPADEDRVTVTVE